MAAPVSSSIGIFFPCTSILNSIGSEPDCSVNWYRGYSSVSVESTGSTVLTALFPPDDFVCYLFCLVASVRLPPEFSLF